ncbi:IPT/TIG domain-containing protein [Streptomyces sp. MS06]|uniref:IPT/TIG domain-containing protein n=1 Tax=Streptomyces sp. MS06 TaxID=3385974 RepID=UPI0039A07FBA
MRIIGFTPESGRIGTPVTLELADMPNDASTENTLVELGGLGQGTGTTLVSVDAVTGTIQLLIGPMAMTNKFHVTVHADIRASSAEYFTVQGAAARISSMRPTSGPPGQQLTLTGEGLGSISRVTFGPYQATNLTHVGETGLRLSVARNAPRGTYQVTGHDGALINVNAPSRFTVT